MRRGKNIGYILKELQTYFSKFPKDWKCEISSEIDIKRNKYQSMYENTHGKVIGSEEKITIAIVRRTPND